MSVICAISDSEVKLARKRIFSAIKKSIADNTPFDLKEYMTNEYNKIFELVPDVSKKHATALEYARIAPQFIEQGAAKIPELFAGLMKIRFDFTNLQDVLELSKNESTGLVATGDYLGLNRNLLQELIDANSRVSVLPVSAEPLPEADEEAGTPYNFLGQTVSSQVPVPFHKAGLPKSAGTNITLGGTPLSDTIGLEGGPDREDTNNFYFKVKRKIIGLMNDKAVYDSREIELEGQPVYLTALSVTAFTPEQLSDEFDMSEDPGVKAGGEPTGVLLALTDSDGDPFLFDEDGNLDYNGKPAYYNLRSNLDVNAKDEERIKNLAEQGFKNLKQVDRLPAARAAYTRQLELVEKMRDHVNEGDKTNMVKSFINGGTVGFSVKDENLKTPIRNVVFEEGESFAPEWESKSNPALGLESGHTYFYPSGFYGQAIEVERPAVDDVAVLEKDAEGTYQRTGERFKDKLISLLVDDIQDAQGNKMSAEARQNLVDYFIMTSPDTIRVLPNTDGTHAVLVNVAGTTNRLDVNTPEGREAAKDLLDKYFSTVNPIREVDSAQGRAVILEKPLGTYKEGDLNKVIQVTTEAGTKFFVLEKPKLHIRTKTGRKSYLGTVMKDVKLTTTPEGQVIMESIDVPYNDFIFNSFQIKYKLDQNKKLRKYDAYFTFQPTDEALAELEGTPILDELAETMEEATAEEATQTELDDLPDDLDLEDLDDTLDELHKMSGQKAADIKASKEQIAAAKVWYENHPMSKVIPFEAMFSMINTAESNSVASWSLAGITLFQGSDYSDLYHEAWHGFTQSFLSKKQKEDLYNEAKKKSGSFTDHNGERVSFKSASYLQIEEYLAEEFRNYMLKGGKAQAKAPVQNSIFRVILNALKALFNNLTMQEMTTDEKANNVIGEMYEKLRVGDLTEYTFSQENVMFGELNKGITATDPNSIVKQLSYENSKLIVDSLDSYISDWIDWRNYGLSEEKMAEVTAIQRQLDGKLKQVDRKRLETELASYGEPKTYKFSSQVFKNPKYLLDAYKYAKNQIVAEYKAVRAEIKTTTNAAAIKKLEKQAKLLLWTHNNFGDTVKLSNNEFEDSDVMKGVIGYHMNKSERYLDQDIKVALDYEGMDEADLFMKGRGFERKGNDASMKDLAKEELIYMIRGLQKVDTKGNKIKNKLGANELVEFQEVWNRLARTLQNTADADLLYDKLQKEAKVYPVIKQLLTKLGPFKTGERGSATQWTNFIQTFTLARIPLIQMTLTKMENETYESHIGQAFDNDTKVGKTWESMWRMNPDLRYTKRDKNNVPYLNLKAIVEDFSVKKEAPANKQLKGRELQFLHAIGFYMVDNADAIKASEDAIEWIHSKILYLQNRQEIVRSAEDIYKAYEPVDITRNGAVVKKIDAHDKDESRYKTILRNHSRYADETSNFMVTNAEGNTQFEHSLNNSMTIMVNTINGVEDYWDLISKPEMAHLNIDPNHGPVNPYAQASNWLNSIFILDDKSPAKYGKRRREGGKLNTPFVKIQYTNLSGILLNQEEGDLSMGVASAKADEVTKLILDFHLSTQLGQVELMRHADKSSSYSAYLKHIYNKNRGGISSKYIENTDFLMPASNYNLESYAMLIPHVNAEFKRIKTMRSIKAADAQNMDFKYWKAGQKFVAFDDVLTTTTQNKLIKLSKTVNDLEVYLKENGDEQRALQEEIANDMAAYFQTQVDKVSERFNENEFIADNIYKSLRDEAKKLGITGLNNTSMKEALLKSFVYNSWINNIETINFFYGDLALYNHKKEEFHKRNAGMGSTGNVYRTDSAMQHLINTAIKRPYSDKNENGNGYRSYDGTMDTAIIQDSNLKSAYYEEYLGIYTDYYMKTEKLSKTAAKAKAVGKLDAYSDRQGGQMNEGDAQGWVSFDSYKILKLAEGSWSDEQDAMYNKVLNNIPISPEDVATFFPTIKSQYFGVLQNQMTGKGQTDMYGLPITAMHKFSLYPLIPTVIKNTNLEKLHKKMMTEGIDYSLFESGSKVGTITKNGTPDQFYAEGRKTISEERFTKNTIFLKYLKNQLEIAPSYKGKSIFPTQLRKLIEDGLMTNGVPSDWKPALKNPAARMKAWRAIKTEDAKEKASDNYKLVKIYENNIRKLTDIKKKELLDEIGWTMKTVNGEEVADGDIKDLIKFVKNQLTRQDMADHEIDFLQVKNGKLKYDLSLSLSAEKIEKLLNALVVKRLIKQTVKGEGLIQISGALFESFGSTDRDYTNATPAELKEWGTNDLPTYHRKADGTTAAMKVKIALQGDFLKLLNAKHLDGERIGTIERLNKSIRDDKWMDEGRNRDMVTMVGVRIPVQGLNSMEFMEVYEFLPAEAGNIIIPPAEIVAKSGSDFDIDKLTVMMPNLKKGRGQNFTRMFNYTEAEAKAAYRKYVEGKKSPLLKAAGVTVDRETGAKEVKDLASFNSLIELMGFEVGNMDEDIEDILLKEGDIVSEEKFIADLVGAKAVENDLIGNIKSILELESNFVNLTQPNSTDIVKEIADDLAADVAEYDSYETVNGETRLNDDGDPMISPTRVFEIEYNLDKHAKNNIAKATLGLGAVDNTYNTVFNRIGFYMSPTAGMSTDSFEDIQLRLDAKAKAKVAAGNKTGDARKRAIDSALTAAERKAYYTPAITTEEKRAFNSYYRQKLFLPHNVVEVGSEVGISLSHDRDANGEHRIADVINQLLNGWVDIAADTWIFNIQGNKEVSPTLLFLLQAGVPAKDAIYFASMPMVRDYVKEQRLAKSTVAEPLGKAPQDNNPNFFRGKAREVILTDPKYGFGISAENMKGAKAPAMIQQAATAAITEDLLDDKGNFKFNMRKKIAEYAKEKENYKYTNEDRAAFLHYLEAENMAMPIRDVKLKMNFDTSKSGTLFEAQDRILMKEELKRDARIPMEMVDKILTDSPIGSFYIQPFQLAIWKDMFPLRNHPLITKFLLDKFRESDTKEDIKNTFGDPLLFANGFRNSLVSLIFQNSLRSFDRNADTFRGYEVNQEIYSLKTELEKLEGSARDNKKRIDLEKKIATLLGLPIENVTLLKQGISRAIEKLDNGTYVYGDKLYVDKNQLQKEYSLKLFLEDESKGGYKSYGQRGLAKVINQAFDTEDEYFNFVYERETLRKSQPYEVIKDTAIYEFKRKQAASLFENKQKESESDENYDIRIKRIAYENYLRDTALTNTFNHWSLFKSDNSYGDQFNMLRLAYPALEKEFGLIQQLSVGVSGGFSNLKLNDNFLEGDTLNVLHEQLLDLMNPSVKKVENPVDNQLITNYFKKLPIVAFLQSGMNTSSAFSMTRIVPQDTFLRMIEQPVKEYVKHFDAVQTENKSDDSNLSSQILERFYDIFVEANSFNRRREKIRGQKLNSAYKLNDSVKKLKQDIADKGKTPTEIKAIRAAEVKAKEEAKAQPIQVLSPPLITADAQGALGFRNQDINSSTVTAVAEANLDKVFIYNAATEGIHGATTGDHAFFGETIANSLGLPTLRTYGAQTNQIKDVDGKITDANRIAIDNIIAAIKADGRTPVFNKDGYGQKMIGKLGTEVNVAKDTFLYLSKQLLENFNYINPGYAGTTVGVQEIQSKQPISDQDVMDMIEFCIT